MLESTMQEFLEKNISIEEIIISELIDAFYEMYKRNELSPLDQIEYLEFINTLFRLKHKYILEYNKERRSFKRDTQLLHLKKIQRLARLKIKKVYKPVKRGEYKPSDSVVEFRKLISALSKKIKLNLSQKTKMLLDELMKERWTVQDKTRLLKILLSDKDARFEDMIESKDKEEIITSFLALLDLKRKDEVEVIQERNFGEIIIKKS